MPGVTTSFENTSSLWRKSRIHPSSSHLGDSSERATTGRTEEVTVDSEKISTDRQTLPTSKREKTLTDIEKEMLKKIRQRRGLHLTKEVLTECADRGMTLNIIGFRFYIVYNQGASSPQDVNTTRRLHDSGG